MTDYSNVGSPKYSTGRKVRIWVSVVWGILLLLFVAAIPFYMTLTSCYSGSRLSQRVVRDSSLLEDKNVRKQMTVLKAEVNKLGKKLDAFLPHTPYIVINTTKNQFYLYDKEGNPVREGFCSSGSYTKLVSERKTWLFKTPRGRMTVLSKTENPVWSKPDWAFIEEGLPVPPAGDASRYERGVLGDYALRMADGYLLHGTLYQRFLGMPVTHGCVRFGDEDLEVVFHTLVVGSYVYIY